MSNEIEDAAWGDITLEVLCVDFKALDQLFLLLLGLLKKLSCRLSLVDQSLSELLVELHECAGLIILRLQVFSEGAVELTCGYLYLLLSGYSVVAFGIIEPGKSGISSLHKGLVRIGHIARVVEGTLTRFDRGVLILELLL